MLVRYLFRMMTALDVARNGLHRTGPVQRNDCGNILDGLRPQTGDNIGDTLTLQLEYAHRLTLAQHFVGCRVIRIDLLNGKIRRMTANHSLGISDNGKISERKKVHFQKTKAAQS